MLDVRRVGALWASAVELGVWTGRERIAAGIAGVVGCYASSEGRVMLSLILLGLLLFLFRRPLVTHWRVVVPIALTLLGSLFFVSFVAAQSGSFPPWAVLFGLAISAYLLWPHCKNLFR